MNSKARPEWCGRAMLLGVGCLASSLISADGWPLGPAHVQAQEADVSGHLSAIWEDPLPERGAPRLLHFLSTRDGGMIALRVTDAQLRVVGGGEGANGRYVTVSGNWRAPARRAGAMADREIEVASIRYSVDPAGASPPPQGAPITGSHPWVTVLCRFSDFPATEPHPLAWYQGLMSGTEPGVDHYWRELSFDQANVSGSGAHGWYDLPQPRESYVNDTTGVANLTLLKNDCAAVADADIHFPDYVGINFQFNEDLGAYSWGGSSSLNIDGEFKSYRMTWLADWADHVTYTHEMGHGFGLPHSSGPYGQVYDSNWDVMSGSWTNRDATWGYIAPHTISYHKDMLGWIPAGRIYDAAVGLGQTITLHRLADLGVGGDFLMARVPRTDGTYYTVETRHFVGYDANLPAEAVIMHHVTDRAYVVDPDNDGDPDDEGARWLPGETFADTASGITITVDSAAGEAFVITISRLGPPHIALDPASLSFEAWQGTDPAPRTLAIRNSGTEPLVWATAADAAWLDLEEASGTAGASESYAIPVGVLVGDLVPDTYTATITVSGNADNSPQIANVELVVRERPDLAAQDIADHLMGVRTALSASELEYLDDTGNANGSFDAGDFRAWLQAEGLMSRVKPDSGEEGTP